MAEIPWASYAKPTKPSFDQPNYTFCRRVPNSEQGQRQAAFDSRSVLRVAANAAWPSLDSGVVVLWRRRS
jgi:hypothetical protein